MSNSTTSIRRRRSIAVALAALVAVAALVWLISMTGDDDESPASDGPAIVETNELSDAADRLGHPVYWVGERDGTDYELSESDSGRVYVRYLDEGTKPGVRSAQFLTVATYPVDDAVAALRRAAKERPRAELAKGEDGAVVLIDPETPGSVRLAYPDGDEQIEVYSPDVKEGLQLVTGGEVQPVP